MRDTLSAGARTVVRSGRPALLVAAVALTLAACTSGGGSTQAAPADPDPSQVVASLGAVPIPPTGSTLPTPTAAPGHPAVLAMGEPVLLHLGRTEALVTALGPYQVKNGPQPGVAEPTTPATLSLKVDVHRGELAIGTDELSSRDETGAVIALRPSGARHATAGSGKSATVTVKGTYPSGSAQVTWRHAGQVLAVWTFTIELD